jgi:predicted helicase
VGAFSDLFARLDLDPRVRGRQFEHICKWFLTNDPTYKTTLRRVWLWDEWDGRWGSDAGIDLVAQDRDGRLWAIQAKASVVCGSSVEIGSSCDTVVTATRPRHGLTVTQSRGIWQRPVAQAQQWRSSSAQRVCLAAASLGATRGEIFRLWANPRIRSRCHPAVVRITRPVWCLRERLIHPPIH